MLSAEIRRAVGSPPSEEAVVAGLRTADLFRNLADAHLETIKELRGKLQALEYANACKAEQIADLRAELNAGRDAADKAALVDHALEFEGSSLVLVRMRITGAGQWTTEPVVDLEHARQIMAADLEQPDETCDCIACNGTGEGQHEGTICSACGGKGI